MNQTATSPAPETLGNFLREPLQVGEPDLAGPLAVFPLFAGEPNLRYLAFGQARVQGFRVSELPGAASVNNLMVENPTGETVLLLDGEEVLGAQQNRTFDVSVLVRGGAKLQVPVSCVEAGRWDGSRHRESFSPAEQTAYPELRREKLRQAREQSAAGLKARPRQGEVWDEIAQKSQRLGTNSPSGAMRDIYEHHRRRLSRMRHAIRHHEGQTGSLVAIDGRLAVLDLVSDPDAYAVLHGPLVQGYALDALEHETDTEPAPPSEDTARGFTLLVGHCRPAQRTRGIGLGEELRFAANGVEGSALVHEGELIHLTAFPQEGHATQTRRRVRTAWVRRPSRRR